MRAGSRSLGGILTDANIALDRYTRAIDIVAAGEWDSIGIRSDYKHFSAGTMLEPSVEYDDGSPTDWVLDGTCTTGVVWGYDYDRPLCTTPAALVVNKLNYPWTHTYLVGGDHGSRGVDNLELIITNAIVLYEISG